MAVGIKALPSDVPQTRRAASPHGLLDSKMMAADKKKIIVLGGDGFCGWPTSLHLSEKVRNSPMGR